MTDETLTPEEWNKQWGDYLDELRASLEKLDSCAEDMSDVCNQFSEVLLKISQFLDLSGQKMIADIYAQNPLLAKVMSVGKNFWGLEFVQAFNTPVRNDES